MSACWRVGRALLLVGALSAVSSAAGAQVMSLALERLSTGACAGTLSAPAVLRSGGEPALGPDPAAFGRLVSELSAAVASNPLGPVIGTGPRGFELALESSVVDIDPRAEAWRRGTRGRDVLTCAGESHEVRPLLAGTRVRLDKALPLGATVGASVGHLRATNLTVVGASLKVALLEEVLANALPDFALRGTLSAPLGAASLTMFVLSADALISDRFVVSQVVLSPFAGAGAVWTRARTQTVDLTPNLDAAACAAGTDPRCVGTGNDDYAHDVRFATLSLLRYRAFGGLSARYRFASFSVAASTDLTRPGLGTLGDGPRGPRQWAVSLAPSLLF